VKKTHTVVAHDTLLHGETLLVVTTRDAENIAGELLAESLTIDLLGHTAVVESPKLLLIVHLNHLHLPGGRAGNIELHLCGWIYPEDSI